MRTWTRVLRPSRRSTICPCSRLTKSRHPFGTRLLGRRYSRACGVPKREREARSDLRTSSPLHLADDSTLALTGGLLRRPEHPPEPRMPRAYSDELAWRVILRWREYGHSVTQISDPEHGLDVSRTFVYDVIKRYEMTGDVKTHQGHGADPLASCALTRYEDHLIVALIIKSPCDAQGASGSVPPGHGRARLV